MATEPLGEREARTEKRSTERGVAAERAEGASDGVRASGTRHPARAAEACDAPTEEKLLQALAARDEEACRALIREHHATMVRVARGFVRSRAVAEEVAQETWVALFQGLGGFRGQASLKTWLFGILVRRARTAGVREHRNAALSQLGSRSEADECDPMEAFFHRAEHPKAGSWAVPPQRWRHNPEDDLLAAELRRTVGEAVRQLPEAQRLVIHLRDGEGWEAAEIAALLERTPNWVRVNLHRARLKVRLAVIERLGNEEAR